MTSRTAIYTRISQDKKKPDQDKDNGEPIGRHGDGLGVQRQEEDCRVLAARLGWDVTHIYVDNDISAFSGKIRPQFEALLDAMKRNEVDALIVWHTDRLYRSMKDLERLIEIADAARVQIRTVNGGDLDLSNSSGRMLARILGSVARQESEHKGERQRRANVQRAESGKWSTANRPFGYTIDGEPLEPEASAYRTAVADVLAGKSIRKVAMEWNAKGLQTTLAGHERTVKGVTKVNSGQWNSPRVRRLLVNPRYAGLRMHRGRVIGKGDWTPLISEDQHRGLVAYVNDPARVKCTTFERKYIGAGVYVCGQCGGVMKSAMPGGRKSYAYVCRDNADVLRAGQQLDDFVSGVVVHRLSQPDAALLLDDRRIDVSKLQTDRAALQARLDELADAFAEGAIDASQLRRGTSNLRVKLSGIDSQLADAARSDPVAGMIADRERVQQHWDAASPAIRGQIVDALMTVTILPLPKGWRSDRLTPARIAELELDGKYVRIEWKR
jgi:DNA invertase Pin-like site-specific DNA recombinase